MATISVGFQTPTKGQPKAMRVVIIGKKNEFKQLMQKAIELYEGRAK